MKKIILFALILFMTLNIHSREKETSFKTSVIDLSKYNNVYFGWFHFKIEQWAAFGFGTKAEWEKSINFVNAASASNLRKLWIKKGLSKNTNLEIAKNKNENPPEYADLYIKFVDVYITDSYSISASVHFIDLKSDELLLEIPKRQYRYNSIFKNFEAKMVEATENIYNTVIIKLSN
jgi:hypothetical protein